MFSTFSIIFGAVCTLVIISLVWRLFSNRQSIPCPAWLSWFVELDNPVLRNNSAKEITAHLGLRPGMQVLDLGCGPGRLTIPIAKQIGPSGSVTAFDIQQKMLERVQRKANTENLDNIKLVQGTAGAGQLGRNAYDRALLVTVLGEIPDQKTALNEIFDCLKPGGLLSITEVIADPHFQTRKRILEQIQSTGFREKVFFGNPISFTLHLEKPIQ